MENLANSKTKLILKTKVRRQKGLSNSDELVNTFSGRMPIFIHGRFSWISRLAEQKCAANKQYCSDV